MAVSEDLVVEDLSELTEEFYEELLGLEPFGEGNAEPVILLQNFEVVESVWMGSEGVHLRVAVRDKQGRRMKLVAFNAPREWAVGAGEIVNIWVSLTMNEWNGTRSIEGRLLRLERDA